MIIAIIINPWPGWCILWDSHGSEKYILASNEWLSLNTCLRTTPLFFYFLQKLAHTSNFLGNMSCSISIYKARILPDNKNNIKEAPESTHEKLMIKLVVP